MKATQAIGEVTRRRPAETRAGALGAGAIVLVSVLDAIGIQVTESWMRVITGVIAVSPAVFTWVVQNGGIRGVVSRIVGGRTPAGPQPAA